MRVILLALCLLASLPARACDLALALAVDISGSVDPTEYEIQMQGLANAMRDGVVAEALVRAEAAVLLVQWTGTSRQEVTIPWTRVRSYQDAEDLAQRIETAPRRWRNFSTAIGDALAFVVDQWPDAPLCKRRIIDVSGDGSSNEGRAPLSMHPELAALGIAVNALAIEESEIDLTAYFWENLIRGEGAFVVTANTFEDYPDRIRMKLIREVTAQISCGPPECWPRNVSDAPQPVDLARR
ncbi:von Willebrand factor type A domain protein [Candidatus Rhodobacter oscarellae]|uniref:von Willebrand factor type A domain protein n=1 Tax=Candidatus Rhodobacter oscarellae TaxID=1675527 RepID=A0A0J9GXG0_9RHOB|nr:DUF1194 domain-containing protein [Candidatus Rhodobacter lobularis]KMW58173.1 von Willebrand factor type A domain protein [Candidatus Rhodobacter lobularis]